MPSTRGTRVGQSNFFLNILFAGIITGIVEISHIFAFATPIYSSGLIHYLPQGMGIILLGAIVCMVIFSFYGSYNGILSGPQAVPAALIGIMAAAVVTAHAATGVTEHSFYTVITLMVCSTLLTGIAMMTLGLSRLGKIIRFIPFPVIGGLLASAGWILVGFSVTIMTNIPLDLQSGKPADIGILPEVAVGTGRRGGPVVGPETLQVSVGISPVARLVYCCVLSHPAGSGRIR